MTTVDDPGFGSRDYSIIFVSFAVAKGHFGLSHELSNYRNKLTVRG